MIVDLCGVEESRSRGVEESRRREVEKSRSRGVEKSRSRGVEKSRSREVEKSRSREVEKSRSREVEKSEVECESKVDRQLEGVFVNSSTLDSSTPNLTEQTGNVYENKGSGIRDSGFRKRTSARRCVCARCQRGLPGPQSPSWQPHYWKLTEQTGNVYEDKGNRIRDSGFRK